MLDLHVECVKMSVALHLACKVLGAFSIPLHPRGKEYITGSKVGFQILLALNIFKCLSLGMFLFL